MTLRVFNTLNFFITKTSFTARSHCHTHEPLFLITNFMFKIFFSHLALLSSKLWIIVIWQRMTKKFKRVLFCEKKGCCKSLLIVFFPPTPSKHFPITYHLLTLLSLLLFLIVRRKNVLKESLESFYQFI